MRVEMGAHFTDLRVGRASSQPPLLLYYTCSLPVLEADMRYRACVSLLRNLLQESQLKEVSSLGMHPRCELCSCSERRPGFLSHRSDESLTIH